MRLKDVLRDVLSDFDARRGRTLLLVVAVSLSTGALVASLGVGDTASRQIGADLAANLLNEVTVVATGVRNETEGNVFPAEALPRALSISTVNAAGMRLDLEAAQLRPRRFVDAAAAPGIRVVAATAGYLDIISGHSLQDSRWLFEAESGYRVALLGAGAARTLGIPTGASTSEAGYEVVLGDSRYDVAGVIDDTAELDNTLIVPYAVGVELVGSDAAARLVVRTEPGAGAPVSEVLPTAIRPDQPTLLTASRVAELTDLRRGVSDQLGRLLGGVGIMLLALTGLLIANAMVVSVVSRTPEIGLRRALGSSRRSVLGMFVCEGALVGLLGGLGGAGTGAWAVVTVAAANNWTAVLDARLTIAGVFLGLSVGVLASLYPAMRAASISPAVAVRVE